MQKDRDTKRERERHTHTSRLIQDPKRQSHFETEIQRDRDT